MPYKSLKEAKDAGFPTSNDGADLTLTQVLKLAEIYDAIKAAGTADNPMAVAWTAWKRIYEKVGDKWVERKPTQTQMQFLENATLLKGVEHDAILQTLNRWIPRTDPRTQKPGKVCYTQSAFAKSVEAWNGVPIVFAPQHPDMDLFAENPEAALEKIGGRLIGKAANARIEVVGHPRLMVKLPISDEDANKLTNEGKLSVSSGFYGAIDEEGHVVSVIPQHILLFPETETNQPVDHGSAILNMTGEDENQGIENAGRVISEENAAELSSLVEKLTAFLKRLMQGGKKPPEEHEKGGLKEGNPKGKEVENMDEKVKEELESVKADLAVANSKITELTAEKDTGITKIAELTAGIADRDEKITNMTEKLKAYDDAKAAAELAARDKEFDELLNAHPQRYVRKGGAEGRAAEGVQCRSPCVRAQGAQYEPRTWHTARGTRFLQCGCGGRDGAHGWIVQCEHEEV
jgi:hypothetical protein